MFPIQDVIPSTRTPRITIALIAISGTALVYQLLLSASGRWAWLMDVGLVPASVGPWNLITALLVPTDLVAGMAGLLALWIFGDNMEDRLGSVGFVGLFVGGGVVAELAAVALDRDARFVLPATAGAVAAVIGTYTRLLPRSRVMVLVPLWREIDLVDVPAPFIAVGWFFVHVLRYAGDLRAPLPVTATLAIPLVGFGVGLLVGQMRGDSHAPCASP